ncbi:MAG: FeoB-associated Cys-rich membrane protein [Eubacteriales bacterium]|nr:FeoB-associated Cys-rich membrane protein [Eubacteriales bacterium]
MPAFLGNLIVILLLAAVVFLVIRSMWRKHKEGPGCTGNCSTCGGCHGASHKAPGKKL